MKRLSVILIILLCAGIVQGAPLTGIKTIPGDYPTIQAAIAALNINGVGYGGVTFNVSAGSAETLSNGSAGLISYTCSPSYYSYSSSPVIFQKSGSGPNPLVTAFTPGTSATCDGMIMIAGADYVTFDGIDLQENPLNTTPTMQMEWGYAVVKKNSSTPIDGCQYVTIKNCTVTLSKSNTGSIGIHLGNHVFNSTTSLNYNTAPDANNGCKIYGNTISNVFNGIDAEGNSGTLDEVNEIGVTAGNIITNFGGPGGNPCGIYASGQDNVKIAGNSITGGNGTTGNLYGIYTGPGSSANVDIYSNTITLTPGSYIYTSFGIRNTLGGIGVSSNTVNIYNNILENFTAPTASAWPSYLISQEANALNVNIYGNILRNNTHYGANYFYCIGESSNVTNGVRNIYNNQISNLSIATSTTIDVIDYNVSSTTTGNIYNNTVHGINSNGGSNVGLFLQSGGTTNVFRNRFYDISTNGNGNSGQGLLTGIYIQATTTSNIYNNYISDLKAPTSTYGYNLDVVDGIYAYSGTNCNILSNTVYLNTSSIYSGFRTACVSMSTSMTNILLKNNILVNLSGASGSGNFATVLRKSATSLANYSLTSNNNLLYSGTPGPNHLILDDFTNSDQTLAAFQARVAPRESSSASELPPFVNAAGYDYHLVAGAGTACESGGQVITTPIPITDDFDGNPRFPNAGYPDNPAHPATAPDIGADEFAGGGDNTPPTITYTALPDPTDNNPRTLTVLIYDAGLGVPVSGNGLPVLYWKKTGDAGYTAVQAVSAGAGQYLFTFGGGVSSGNVVSYYVAAQDLVVPANVSAWPSTGVAGFTSSPPAVSTPPSNPSTYTVQSPMIGVWTIPGDLPSIQTAIATLNFRGVGTGGVTFNVAGNYTETLTGANSGLINYTCAASSYSSITNPVVFQRSGPGANPMVTAFTPGTTTNLDGIIKIAGADYVTIDGIDLQENPLNTTSTMQMEWGYALLKKNSISPADGCQNVIIRNCTITLNKANTGSIGIHIGAHSAASATGVGIVTQAADANNNCKIYSNTISNVYTGIDLEGNSGGSAYYDAGNEIGVAGSNNITGFGGASLPAEAIYVSYQNNFTIANNVINGGTGTTGNLYGINLANGTGSGFSITGNTISLSAATANIYGIYNNMGMAGESPNTINLNNNTIQNLAGTLAGDSYLYGIYQNATANTININGNIIRNLVKPSTGQIYGIYQFNAAANAVEYIQNNQVYSISSSGTSAVYGIENNPNSTTTGTISGNTIHGLSSAGGSAYGMDSRGMAAAFVYKNRVYDIATSSSGTVNGIYLYANTTVHVYNNYVSDLQIPGSAGAGMSLTGITLYNGTTANLFNNTVSLNSASPNVAYSVAALYIFSNTTALTLKNNILVNQYISSGTYYSSAFFRSGSDLANYMTGSDNNLYYAGTPGPHNLIFYNGSTSYQTLATFQAAVAPREAASVTELPPFIDPASFNYHLQAGIETKCESGGQVVNTPVAITDDFDGDARYPNAGYPVSGLDPSTAPDIGADEFAGGHYHAPPVITYTPLGNPATVAAQTLTATITDATSGVPVSGTGLPVLYWKKNNAVTYAAVQGNSTGNNQYNFTFGSGVSSGDVIYYYIVAQGTWAVPNVGANPNGSVTTYTSSPPVATPPPVNPNSYTVQSPMSGTVTVGTSGKFPTLTGASGLFQNINNSGLEGNLVAVIQSDLTEPGTYALNQWSESGAGNYTLTIQPDATTQRVISGTTVAASTPMINLNGADRVTINGGSGKYLLFRNTLASPGTTGPAIGFTNGATSDTLKYCVAECNSSATTAGVVNIGTTGANSVYIANCDLRNPTGGTAGLPYCGIFSSNAGNTVNLQSNNIYNWSNAGISLSNVANGCTINGNNLYETSVQTTSLYGIYILAGSGHTITGNNFGGANASRTGAAMTTSAGVLGIVLSVGTSSPTSVQGNHLSNFGSTGSIASAAVYGIQVLAGNVNIGTVTGNVFGGGALPSDTIRSGYDNGIIYCTGSGIVNIENNTVGNIAHWVGGNDRTAGVVVTAGTVHIKNNIIRDIKSNSNGTGYIYLPVGIQVNSTGSLVNPVIEGNTITNIWNFNTALLPFMAIGIVIQSSSVNNIIVRNNKISNIYATAGGTGSNSPQLYGIYNYGTATSIYNNMISMGQSPAASESRLFGIYDISSSANSYYFNSVSISGTASGSNSSYAFYTAATGTNTVKDNIFSNTRSGGTVKSYAIGAAASVSMTSNYNDLFAAGVSLGLWNATNCATIAAWRTASSQDAGSISGDPLFVSVSDLHITATASTPVKNAGLYLAAVTTDYDGETRNNPPDIGADEFTIAPTLITSAATLVTYSSATLNGTVNANGETVAVSFQYGLTTSYGSSAAAAPASATGTSVTAVSTAISSLLPGTTYHYRVSGISGNISFYGSDMTVVTPMNTKTLNLTSLLLEGLYAGNGTMNLAYDENGPHWAAGIADHITVELHSATPGYYNTVLYTATDVALTTNGHATVTVPGTFGGSYYITVKHRNSLETVSATPVSFAGNIINQSFGAPAAVYGGNVAQMSDGYYVIFGGDVYQDGLIDISDFAPVDNEAAQFGVGYLPEDVNGDGLIDISDFAIIDNNAALFIGAITP
ncbi:MAG: hypothetical protein WCO44_15650 [Bacteroidota bacterium]